MDKIDLAKRRAAVPGGNRHSYRIVQGLRFVAAFAVVVLHCSFYTSERLDGSLGIYAAGANGVRLFFVISGFVMIVASCRLGALQNGWSIFAVRRIARIVPLYWLVTTLKLATLIATPTVVLHAKLDWAFVLKSYFFIPATNVDGELHPLLGVGWTLNFEMMFYALFTLALALRVRPLTLIAPVLLLLSVLSLFRTPAWPDAARFWCDPIVLDFLAGMLIGHAVLANRLTGVIVGGILFVGGLIYLGVPFPRPDYRSLLGSLLTTLAASSTVLGAVALEAQFGRRVPAWVLFGGAASYSLYLIHPLIAPAVPAAFAKLSLPWPAPSIFVSIVIAMIGGAFLYRHVEQRLARWSDALLALREWTVGRPVATPGDQRH